MTSLIKQPHSLNFHAQNLKAEMVVLDPGRHIRIMIQVEGLARLPGAVKNAEIDMTLLSLSARLGSVPGHHVPAGANGTVPVKDRHEQT